MCLMAASICFRTDGYYDSDDTAIVHLLSTALIADRVICEASHWFGGVSSSPFVGEQSCRRKCADCLIRCISSDSQCISLLGAVLPKADDFVQLYLGDDEHLLSALAQICRYELNNHKTDDQASNLPSHLHPVLLWLYVLLSTAFDCDLLIDWLLSESIACVALLRLFKLIEIDPKLIDSKATYLADNLSSQSQSSKNSAETAKCEHGQDSHSISVRIKENVNGVTRFVDFGFCDSVNLPNQVVNSSVQSTSITSEQIVKKFNQLLCELRVKLMKYSSAGLFPYNIEPLLKRSGKVLDFGDQSMT